MPWRRAAAPQQPARAHASCFLHALEQVTRCVSRLPNTKTMPKFELGPGSGGLLLSGIATAAFGASMLLAPRKSHSYVYGHPVSSLPC